MEKTRNQELYPYEEIKEVLEHYCTDDFIDKILNSLKIKRSNGKLIYSLENQEKEQEEMHKVNLLWAIEKIIDKKIDNIKKDLLPSINTFKANADQYIAIAMQNVNNTVDYLLGSVQGKIVIHLEKELDKKIEEYFSTKKLIFNLEDIR